MPTSALFTLKWTTQVTYSAAALFSALVLASVRAGQPAVVARVSGQRDTAKPLRKPKTPCPSDKRPSSAGLLYNPYRDMDKRENGHASTTLERRATSSSVAFSCSSGRGRASGRRSGHSVRAVSVRRAPSARAPRRSSRGRSLARSPRRGRGCRVRVPAGRSFEDGPARSTLLLPGGRDGETERNERRAVGGVMRPPTCVTRRRGSPRSLAAGSTSALLLAAWRMAPSSHSSSRHDLYVAKRAGRLRVSAP